MIIPPPDDPIEPRVDARPFIAEIIDLDGVRIQWGLPASRGTERCKHTNLTYSTEERRVWCQDCKRTIENFDAFKVLVDSFQRMELAARLKLEKAEAAMAATIHRRATKAVDKAWSSSLPAIGCPHCRAGLLPEDFEAGVKVCTSREYELARRKRSAT